MVQEKTRGPRGLLRRTVTCYLPRSDPQCHGAKIEKEADQGRGDAESPVRGTLGNCLRGCGGGTVSGSGVAIDAKQVRGEWKVHVAGGTIPTELNLFEWAKEVEKRGAGEILFTSMNNDGTKTGFANEALAKLSTELNIPIIASGGAGTVQHFVDTFKKGKSDAALAASVFHFGEIKILELKQVLKEHLIPVRI